VNLIGAIIGTDLDCKGGQFINKSKMAICADGLKVGGAVFWGNGLHAEGEMRLVGAKIGGYLDCEDGHFSNSGGIALNVNEAQVEGSIRLGNGFSAEGEVNLIGTTIGASLDCGAGQFINKEGVALSADGLKAGHAVFLRNHFRAEGKVSFVSATVSKHFVWQEVSTDSDITLDLRTAKIGILRDEKESWPKPGKLLLHGFVYDELGNDAPTDARNRIDWLHHQPRDQFLLQPYEQLASVLRKAGHDEDARAVLIAKNKDRARYTKVLRQDWFWYHLFGRIIGYGYRPWRAFWASLVIIALGTFLFGKANDAGLMTPTSKEAYITQGASSRATLSQDYPVFSPIVYSVETFVPLVKLHVADYYLPNANLGVAFIIHGHMFPTSGSLLRVYLWVHTIAGWVLTTLWVGALAGLIKT
jgi:hypothetical protein